MDKLATPTVITAIADPDFEGLVSSALFNQGWSVIARALDMKSLEIEIAKCDVSQIILIYSSDLPGISLAQLHQITRSGVTLFGFADATGSAQGLPEISPRPTSPAELLAYIRGNIRSPSLRTPLLQPTPNLKARINRKWAKSSKTPGTSNPRSTAPAVTAKPTPPVPHPLSPFLFNETRLATSPRTHHR
jgi:hypothetical protein